MKDRIVEFPNRYKLAPVAGTTDTFDLVPVPGTVTEEGDDISKDNFLPDTVGRILNLPQANPQIKDALVQIAAQGKYVYVLTVKAANGSVLTGITVAGLDIPSWGSTVTDSNGVFVGLSASTNPTISIASQYVDLQSYSGSITSTGPITNANITLQLSTPAEILYTTSTTVKFATNVNVDVHCISAGKNGENGFWSDYSRTAGRGGYSGGQAYSLNIIPTKNTPYSIVVPAANGGQASAFGVTSPSTENNGGLGGTFNPAIGTGTSASAGVNTTIKKYGTGAVVGGGSGGGGATQYDPSAKGSKGAPFGGDGGVYTSVGAAATGYGGGGGGGGVSNSSGYGGGAGYQGVVYMTWRFAS